MQGLLVVDLQKEFADEKGTYNKCLEYIEENRSKYDKVIAVKYERGNKHFEKYLDTDFPENPSGLDFMADLVFSKTGYGVDDKTLLILRGMKWDIVGAHTFGVILDLWDEEIDFRILADYNYATASVEVFKNMFGRAVISDGDV